jgi:hypothetical protein
MDELEHARTKLGDMYTATTEPDISLLELLRRYIAYADFLKTNPVLSRLIASIRKQIASTNITDIQKSIADPVYGKVVHMRQEIADLYDEQRGFPLYILSQLEDTHTAFNALGDEKDEKIFGEKNTTLKHATKDGEDEYTETTSGNGLLLTAQHVYPKQIPILHTRLIEELDRVIETNTFPTYFDYDSEKGVLYVQGKPVQINNRKTPTNAHYLLEYLFANDPFTEHYYQDMVADNALFEEKSWTVYYHTCKDIEKKVKDATGIDEFLDFSTGSSLYVRISPKYSLNPSD